MSYVIYYSSIITHAHTHTQSSRLASTLALHSVHTVSSQTLNKTIFVRLKKKKISVELGRARVYSTPSTKSMSIKQDTKGIHGVQELIVYHDMIGKH